MDSIDPDVNDTALFSYTGLLWRSLISSGEDHRHGCLRETIESHDIRPLSALLKSIDMCSLDDILTIHSSVTKASHFPLSNASRQLQPTELGGKSRGVCSR